MTKFRAPLSFGQSRPEAWAAIQPPCSCSPEALIPAKPNTTTPTKPNISQATKAVFIHSQYNLCPSRSQNAIPQFTTYLINSVDCWRVRGMFSIGTSFILPKPHWVGFGSDDDDKNEILFHVSRMAFFLGGVQRFSFTENKNVKNIQDG